MGNSNVKESYHNYQQYDSQYSLSNLLSGSCVASTQASNEKHRSLFRASHRSWTNGTLQNIHASSKTVWPVPRFQSIFLPEFSIKEIPMKTGYTFLDVISKGTYGKVYKVQKQETGQVFALKVISKAKIVAENSVKQAKEEVAIQRMVGHHPFIVNSIHRWQSKKTLYILMDYISGGELLSLVDEFGCLPEEVVRIYVAEIALAIDFLHNAGIVHRDLKTTNVLLDEDGHAVIIDFGFAKWLQRTERTNTLCGTPLYMAPEILRKEYYGHEVDWWSLGVLACFLLTNEDSPEMLLSSGSRGEPQGRGDAIGRRRLTPPAGRARWCIMRYTGITGIIRITRITSIIRTYVRPRKNRPGMTAPSFFDSLLARLVSFLLRPHLSSPPPRLPPASPATSSSSFPARGLALHPPLQPFSSIARLILYSRSPILSPTSSVIFLP
ncbi:serine/threonine-protein kinase S6KL isoform X1 [Anoplolepis gracilipes]|uniref:serine/threonine-protein kinase S6KL isoform X1 n=1 Tax=Anoplolepis gracilipes TaxID=354296 RepID=UPI003BA2EA4B